MAKPANKVNKWSGFTLQYIQENLLSSPDTGCVTRTVHQFYDHKVDEPEWKGAVETFRHLQTDELPKGYVDGFSVESVLMDNSRYMDWLLREYQQLGGMIEQKTITSFDEVPKNYEIIVNCSGLGARELCNDTSLRPVRGQVVRVKRTSFDLVTDDDHGPHGMCYIVPRIDDVIIGGTAEENNWSLEANPKTTEKILKSAAFFSPTFENAEVLEVKVGLRPVRDEVRVETERFGDKTVVHNYGHGGAGFTLSWGCANEVVDLVKQMALPHRCARLIA